jgi:hypothetical protein
VPLPLDALPHRARVVQTDRVGEKNVQGEREALEATGPWFPARRMTPRPSKGDREAGGRRRTEVRWVLLYGDEDEDGEELQPPRESDLIDVDRDGQVTRYVVGPRPRELDTGEEILGGQVELVEAGDSS